MASNEEYLDSLLKSISSDEEKEELQKGAENQGTQADEFADALSMLESITESPAVEEGQAEPSSDEGPAEAGFLSGERSAEAESLSEEGQAVSVSSSDEGTAEDEIGSWPEEGLIEPLPGEGLEGGADGRKPENDAEGTAGKLTGGAAASFSDEISGNFSDGTPGKLPDDTGDKLSDLMAESILNDIPEGSSDKRTASKAPGTGAVFEQDPEVGEVDGVDMSDMDALLSSVSGERKEPEKVSEIAGPGKTDEEPAGGFRDEVDTAIPFEAGGEDGDLEEITSLLRKSDNNEPVDDDMLALLQSLSDEKEEPQTPGRDAAREGRTGTPAGEESGAQEVLQDEKSRKAAEKKAKREARRAEKLAKKKKKGIKSGGTEETSEEENGEAEAAGNVENEPGFIDISAAEPDEGENGLAELSDRDKDPGPQKKKGFFAKIIDFLTEEDESEDEEDSLNLSEENQKILKDMKKEDQAEGKKKKKGGKKKKEKETPQKEGGDTEGEGEEGSREKKGKKEKKPKKTKEEKAAALEGIQEAEPGKKLSTKKIIPVAVLAMSITAALVILSNISGDYSNRKLAAEAYYKGDYESCYQNLFGKDLDESEQVMFNKSEAILRMEMNMKEYELYAGNGKETEALDCLIRTVNDYPSLYESALQWNAGEEVSGLYGQAVTALEERYRLNEEQAKEIAAEPDDVRYTRIVTAVAAGSDYAQWKEEQSRASMKDVLPEEEKLLDQPLPGDNLGTEGLLDQPLPGDNLGTEGLLDQPLPGDNPGTEGLLDQPLPGDNLGTEGLLGQPLPEDGLGTEGEAR